MKRVLVSVLIFFILFSFSACSENSRPDYEMLSERLGEVNEHYAFDYFDMFLYDGAYHVYFSLCSEDDIMLSMVLDEENNIDSLCITAEKSKMATDGQRTAFQSFAGAITESFCTLSDKEKTELNEALSIDNINFYFSDLFETYSALRYEFIFSSNSEYIVFSCEYVQAAEDFT